MDGGAGVARPGIDVPTGAFHGFAGVAICGGVEPAPVSIQSDLGRAQAILLDCL